jgi:hypothetical protein
MVGYADRGLRGSGLPFSGCRHPARPDNARCDGCPLSETPWWAAATIAGCDRQAPDPVGAPTGDL